MSVRRPTATSNFGVSRRESHDASGFYARFVAPIVTVDDHLDDGASITEAFYCGDSRKMDEIPDDSVALVVTSPPYFAGKQYEEELGRDGVPASYVEYLDVLRSVFRECRRVLEPGGRIAINVANLGRKPYRSLAADVVGILQDDLQLWLRGEIVWKKGDGASGSCAWGSFRSPMNPVLRDVTERVVIASKGRFDRALSAKRRLAMGLAHESTITSDEFMTATLDLWDIAPESARRVRHPAPFPVELPERLIELYTFRDDLVLDPFMGSGSSLVAAARTGRRYVGYDLDPSYVEIAKQRVKDELQATEKRRIVDEPAESFRNAVERLVNESAFTITARNAHIAGTQVDMVASDVHGESWYFLVSGAFTSVRAGLARKEALWSAIGRAALLTRQGHRGVVLLTSHLPKRSSEGDQALRSAGPSLLYDVIDVQSESARRRFGLLAMKAEPVEGFWTNEDLTIKKT